MSWVVWVGVVGVLIFFIALQLWIWIEHREFMLRLAIKREMQITCDNEKLNLLIAIYPTTLHDCSTYDQAIRRISDSVRPLPAN